jgi:hypothetical protein
MKVCTAELPLPSARPFGAFTSIIFGAMEKILHLKTAEKTPLPWRETGAIRSARFSGTRFSIV